MLKEQIYQNAGIFSDMYGKKECLGFDEVTSRVNFRVYNPMKPNRFGIKLYQVCEQSLDIYYGDSKCIAKLLAYIQMLKDYESH